MFEHVTTLLSFVYAIALTHLFSSATGLILARRRVRFSPLLALWMVFALLIVFNNWFALWLLRSVDRWSVGEALLEFVTAGALYFTCSLLCMEAKENEPVDMVAWYEEQRVAFLSAFVGLYAVAMFWNYFHRNLPGPAGPAGWIHSDFALLPVLLMICASIRIRASWLEWLTPLVGLLQTVVFLFHSPVAR